MVRKINKEEFDILVKKYIDQGHSEKVAKKIVRSRLKQMVISPYLICKTATPLFPMQSEFNLQKHL